MISDEQLKAARKSKPAPSWVGEGSWTNDPVTEKQEAYIARLVSTRQVPEAWLLRIKEYKEAGTLTKGLAGRIISSLNPLPWKPEEERVDQMPTRAVDAPGVGFDRVPAGYYAIPIEAKTDKDNDYSFYKVWKPKDVEDRGKVYHILGPNDSEVTRRRAFQVLRAIMNFGVWEAAILYGRETRRCSKCHRRLTNRISRELSIGPVCGGRVYGEGWQDRVNEARQAILERGEDPDEKIED